MENLFVIKKIEGNYTCPMHPEISGNEGDKCPICGMFLIPKA